MIIYFFSLGIGNGGVGKSYLSRTICKWTEKILSKSGLIKTKVIRLAYAAIAASNIGNHVYYFVYYYEYFSQVLTLYFHAVGGTTLHSGIGFQFSNDQSHISKEKLDKLKKELEEAEVIIIDELSMISVDNFYYINQRMMDIFDSKDDFGGRALIMVGDVLQLPPVMGRPIF